jgi:Na+/melibiose symporter-like transporter
MFMHHINIALCVCLFVAFTIEEISQNCLLIFFFRVVILVGITLLYPSCTLSIPFKSEEERVETSKAKGKQTIWSFMFFFSKYNFTKAIEETKIATEHRAVRDQQKRNGSQLLARCYLL